MMMKCTNPCFNRSHPVVYLIFNKMFYTVFTQLQFVSSLATFTGFFYKTSFMTSLTIGRYIQCMHTLWNPIVITQNHNNRENFFKMQY